MFKGLFFARLEICVSKSSSCQWDWTQKPLMKLKG